MSENGDILAVDDTFEVLALLVKILTPAGHKVRAADSGELALAAAAARPPDLILLDVRMKGVDGLEVCRRLKAQEETRHVPVILISGSADAVDRIEGLRHGAADYITKPFHPEELLSRVKMHLSLSRATISLQKQTIALRQTNEQMQGEIRERRRVEAELRQSLEEADRSRRAMLSAFEDLQRAEAQVKVRHRELQVLYGVANGLAVSRVGPEVYECIARELQKITSGSLTSFSVYNPSKKLLRVMHVALDKADGGALLAVPGVIPLKDSVFDVSDEIRSDLLRNSVGYGLTLAQATFGSIPSEVGTNVQMPAGIERFLGVTYKLGGKLFGTSVVALRAEIPDPAPDLMKSFAEIVAISLRRLLAEDELRQSEEKFRSLFEVSRDAILTLEPPLWTFSAANPAAVSMFRVKDAAALMSCGPAEFASESQRNGRNSADVIREKIEAALREGAAHFDVTQRRIDGEEFPASVSLTRMDRGGKSCLQATIRDISEQKRIEGELGHSRKLEAVGQLASGIAHEINTPTQYVGDGVHFLKDAFEGYRRLLDHYERAVGALEPTKRLEELSDETRAIAEDIDLAYLDANVPDCFDRCIDGVLRIATIVRAMKEFAHPDQQERSAADLNQALQSTLTIARNEYKYVADVSTDFGVLPPVICYVSALNQVFLNLVVNAAHAIGDVVGRSGSKGQICVRTMLEGSMVRIDIEDTGAGIPEAIRHRIFDPFFTTKEVGKGSGQGLAIAHSIVVVKHHGMLTFESELGRGTTFTIRLPIDGDGASEKPVAS